MFCLVNLLIPPLFFSETRGESTVLYGPATAFACTKHTDVKHQLDLCSWSELACSLVCSPQSEQEKLFPHGEIFGTMQYSSPYVPDMDVSDMV